LIKVSFLIALHNGKWFVQSWHARRGKAGTESFNGDFLFTSKFLWGKYEAK